MSESKTPGNDLFGALGSLLGGNANKGLDLSAINPEAVTALMGVIGGKPDADAQQALAKDPDLLATLGGIAARAAKGEKVSLADIPAEALQKAVSLITDFFNNRAKKSEQTT